MSYTVSEKYAWKLEDRISDLEQENEIIRDELKELKVLNKVYFDNLKGLGANPNQLIDEG